VASLEARLGVTLLQRTTRRLTTTDVRQTLALSARAALVPIDTAENQARGADRLSGVLRISLPVAYGVREIILRLPGFLALQPKLKIELMMSDRYDDLVAEGADLALRLGNLLTSAIFILRNE
jgi:DNA-binding transcriptional LysR family regulator